MSVAFRRESDDEPLEPRFEIPLPPGPNRVTRAGVALIAARIAELEERLAAIAADDEAAVQATRRDLRYWQTRRATAEPTFAPEDGTVGFGTYVDVAMGGRTRRLAIVGDDEADPHADRIAFSAPLARALAGAEPGDVLPFNGREGAIRVLAVAPIDDPAA
ncbi:MULTISPECIES: GreA/GreB family elongation factor [unclassified Sphingomonas]|uniref:GreA/GreB family elongation factor n=1 Tax=unclassified Sphingomonas TaxID=196159 RepID=UPI000E10795B|nr:MULTISPECIES: GreA/GreB family elongation factor [unclassified Sphingomonas]AXJ95899.1 nucleoside-diphosphate kinase [Sphingomonas sp. FARSPH]